MTLDKVFLRYRVIVQARERLPDGSRCHRPWKRRRRQLDGEGSTRRTRIHSSLAVRWDGKKGVTRTSGTLLTGVEGERAAWPSRTRCEGNLVDTRQGERINQRRRT